MRVGGDFRDLDDALLRDAEVHRRWLERHRAGCRVPGCLYPVKVHEADVILFSHDLFSNTTVLLRDFLFVQTKRA